MASSYALGSHKNRTIIIITIAITMKIRNKQNEKKRKENWNILEEISHINVHKLKKRENQAKEKNIRVQEKVYIMVYILIIMIGPKQMKLFYLPE